MDGSEPWSMERQRYRSMRRSTVTKGRPESSRPSDIQGNAEKIAARAHCGVARCSLSLAHPIDRSRSLRAARLALHRARGFFQCFPKGLTAREKRGSSRTRRLLLDGQNERCAFFATSAFTVRKATRRLSRARHAGEKQKQGRNCAAIRRTWHGGNAEKMAGRVHRGFLQRFTGGPRLALRQRARSARPLV